MKQEKTERSLALIGNFGAATATANGQVIKTQTLYRCLCGYVEPTTKKLDTNGWKRHPVKMLFSAFRLARENRTLIMCVAHNGVGVFAALLDFFRRRYGNRVFYSVVGGWLPDMLDRKRKLKKRLLRFDGLLVETETMARRLSEQGFRNVHVIRNFKQLTPVRTPIEEYRMETTCRFCIFSRVSREKGIPDAISAVCRLHDEGFPVELHIYGSVVEDYQEEFSAATERHPEIVYHGMIAPSESVRTICRYDALIFPTRSFTEGVPGTIVDAYAAALPVIASEWESASDILNEKTAILYPFGKSEELVSSLRYALTHREKLVEMRSNALKEAEKYSAATNMKQLEGILYENSSGHSESSDGWR